MLIRFHASNFRSFKGDQGLSMVASSLAGAPEAVVHFEDLGLDLLRVAAIYGANAAGKSNVLAALQFISRAVKNSHREWKPDGPIPRDPFLLEPTCQASPSRFEVDFLLDGVRFQYGLTVDSSSVMKEWLYSFPKGRRQRWFNRDAGKPQPFDFGKTLRGNNRMMAALARKNSLFLSVAAENNHPMLSPVYFWLTETLKFSHVDDPHRMDLTLKALRARKSAVVDFVRLADLGITDLTVKEMHIKPKHLQALKRFVDEIGAAQGADSLSQIIEIVEFKHSAPALKDDVSLSLAKESRGTQAWLSLIGTLLDTLETGGVLCIDELDASLHPRLALEIIRIFEDPERNPKNAQLIFNTHNPTLLGNMLEGPGLRRDQVWLVEKDSGGATHLYPMTDFKPRKEENLERGYLQGRYGAVPFITPNRYSETSDG
jgi:hypothetical protein